MKPEYVGLDYHTKYAIATRMNQEGTILGKDRIENNKEEIRAYLSELPERSKVALEATNNWYAFIEWVDDLPIEVKLAHPVKTKAIAHARIKTDTVDSKILADLLRTNFIAEAYLAPKEIRDTRELVRFRTTLKRIRTTFTNRIHNVLFKNGEKVEARDVTGKKGREQLAGLPLRSIYREEIESCLAMCDYLDEQIKRFSEEIKRQAEVNEDAKLLMSIPGISFFSALLITTEIGDYRRFSSSRKLCSFAGLVPSLYQSGGKTRRGRITKQGSKNLRFVLLQAVPHVVKKSKRLGRRYFKVMRKKGKKTARIAVAREVLAVILYMLKSREVFRADC